MLVADGRTRAAEMQMPNWDDLRSVRRQTLCTVVAREALEAAQKKAQGS